jgi:hypothetical protein
MPIRQRNASRAGDGLSQVTWLAIFERSAAVIGDAVHEPNAVGLGHHADRSRSSILAIAAF